MHGISKIFNAFFLTAAISSLVSAQIDDAHESHMEAVSDTLTTAIGHQRNSMQHLNDYFLKMRTYLDKGDDKLYGQAVNHRWEAEKAQRDARQSTSQARKAADNLPDDHHYHQFISAADALNRGLHATKTAANAHREYVEDRRRGLGASSTAVDRGARVAGTQAALKGQMAAIVLKMRTVDLQRGLERGTTTGLDKVVKSAQNGHRHAHDAADFAADARANLNRAQDDSE